MHKKLGKSKQSFFIGLIVLDTLAQSETHNLCKPLLIGNGAES